MYRGLLITHNLFRWVVILAGAAAVASAAWSLVQRQAYGPRHASLGRAFVITVDIQVVMGAALYALFSPLTTVAMVLGITPPPGSEMHFFSVTHVQIMAAVLVGVHLSAVIIRRGHGGGIARLRRSVVCYGLTLALLVFGVPWWRPLLRF